MKYWFILAKSFKSQTMYRSAVLSKLVGSALALFIQANLWTALLSAGVRQDTTLGDMLVYVLVSMFIGELTHINIATMLEPEIRDGSVSRHFLKPVSFKLYCICSAMGKNLYSFVVSFLPALLLALVFFSLPPVLSAARFALFLLSACLGVFIVLELSYIAGLLAFCTQRAWYLNWYLSAGKTIFGGAAVPIWFYPAFLSVLSRYLPFRYVSFEPINILLGKPSFAPVSVLIVIALCWLLALCALSHLLYRHILKRITVNGG